MRTSAKRRQKGPTGRGSYAPEPVQGRVITRHVFGQSNRSIAREEGIDRKTVSRILTQLEVVEKISEYQQRLLGLAPEAIEVLREALSSDDERVRVAVATKLLEGLQVMPRGGRGQTGGMRNPAASYLTEEDAELAKIMAIMDGKE